MDSNNIVISICISELVMIKKFLKFYITFPFLKITFIETNFIQSHILIIRYMKTMVDKSLFAGYNGYKTHILGYHSRKFSCIRFGPAKNCSKYDLTLDQPIICRYVFIFNICNLICNQTVWRYIILWACKKYQKEFFKDMGKKGAFYLKKICVHILCK